MNLKPTIAVLFALTCTACSGSIASRGQSNDLTPSTGASDATRNVSRNDSPTYHVVYRFRRFDDGVTPETGLTLFNGMLYGELFWGGSNSEACRPLGCGALFSIEPSTGRESMVYHFKGGADGTQPLAEVVSYNGALWGTTVGGNPLECAGSFMCGTLFSFDPRLGEEKPVFAFPGKAHSSKGAMFPEAPLVVWMNTFYGTSGAGGKWVCTKYPGSPKECGTDGTIFSFDPASSAEKVLHRFTGPSGGAYPTAGMIVVNGKLFGTTNGGGTPPNVCPSPSIGCGTIFTVTSSGEYKVVYRFKGGNDGANPNALVAVGNLLYGTTELGGATTCNKPPQSERGCGTIFSFNPTTGIERVLYRFQTEDDGAFPEAALIASHGVLYGTTFGGGSPGYVSYDGNGTVFSFNPRTLVEDVIHHFSGGADGANPSAPLSDVNGVFFGTTSGGGGAKSCGPAPVVKCGTVFSIRP